MPHGKIPTALLLLVLASSSTMSLADAAYYRWVDPEGNIKFSERPPPDGTDHELINHQNPFSPDSAEETGSDESTEAIEKDTEQCQIARTNLKSLTSSEQVKVRTANGDVRLLSRQEIQAQIERALRQITDHCY